MDMIVDATLFLWGKCKAVFQKYQTGSLENWRYIQKMDQAGKVWCRVLSLILINQRTYQITLFPCYWYTFSDCIDNDIKEQTTCYPLIFLIIGKITGCLPLDI